MTDKTVEVAFFYATRRKNIMLWNSTAKTVVQQMLQEAQYKATVERKKNALKALNYYHDQQIPYIEEFLEAHTDPTIYKPVFFNVVKKIINQLSMVYLADAKREIDGTDRDKEINLHIINSTNLNLKMKTASRYTQLLKTILLRPVWRKGDIDLDILTPDLVDVVIGDTPEDIKQVIVTHYPQSGKAEEITYSLWNADQFQRLDYIGNAIETEDNPYHIIPFLPLWASYPALGSFWASGGDDLLSVQEAIFMKLTDLMLVLEYQGFGIPVAKGLSDSGRLQIGPNSAIEIENPEGSFSFEKSNAPIAQILSSIEFLAKNLAISNGLSAESMSVKPTQTSGLSRIAGNRELEELRRDQISLFGRYERQLFDMLRVVWNTHNPNKKISDTARLKIDFFDPKPVMSPDKQVESWEKELEMGTISRTDILQLKNPDLSREDAEAKLAEILAENKQFNNPSTETLKQKE
ncbi:MAG TPA: hypothetical protein PLS62_11210 [Desulfobacteraceae bacterium]|nr:hypothetical protein [Desulfobacteraceae bacterium]